MNPLAFGSFVVCRLYLLDTECRSLSVFDSSKNAMDSIELRGIEMEHPSGMGKGTASPKRNLHPFHHMSFNTSTHQHTSTQCH
jgi:hypothetical protein